MRLAFGRGGVKEWETGEEQSRRASREVKFLNFIDTRLKKEHCGKKCGRYWLNISCVPFPVYPICLVSWNSVCGRLIHGVLMAVWLLAAGKSLVQKNEEKKCKKLCFS